MNTTVLQTVSLSRSFGQLTAVDRVDLVVPAGSIYGLPGAQWSRKNHHHPHVAGVRFGSPFGWKSSLVWPGA